VVLLTGEAGIGKSRLTAALLERLASEPHTRLRYFCSPQRADRLPSSWRAKPAAVKSASITSKGDHDQSQPTPPAVCGLPRRRGAALLEILNFRRPFKVPGHPDGHGQKRTLSGSVRPGGHGQNLEGCPSLSGLCPVPFSYL